MTPPYKCPDCGIWWSGPEHRCPPITTTLGGTVTFTARCNCVYSPEGVRVTSTVTCPVHDVYTTYAMS